MSIKPWWIAILMLFGTGACLAQAAKNAAPMPKQITLGRYSFIDVGPPFDSYEVITIRSTDRGIHIERASLAPPGDACFQAATATTAKADLPETMADLLGNVSPCSIPQKELNREIKRCKHCLTFSGSKVTMEVQCGTATRHIRMDVLDRDMFDKNANTPKNTSWTMGLMGRIDEALGSDNIMDKPIFSVASSSGPAPAARSELLEKISSGSLDELFGDTPEKISDLAKQSQTPPPTPAVHIAGELPTQPLSSPLPLYPPIARAAHVEGVVKVQFEIGKSGEVLDLKIVDGHPMLRGTVESAIQGWKFPADAAGQSVSTAIAFNLSCPKPKP